MNQTYPKQYHEPERKSNAENLINVLARPHSELSIIEYTVHEQEVCALKLNRENPLMAKLCVTLGFLRGLHFPPTSYKYSCLGS